MGIIQKLSTLNEIEKFKRKLELISGIHIKMKRLSPSSSEELRTVKILNTFQFNKVLDIGANTGQFAESLIDFGFKGKIVSFEPTSKAYHKLVKRASKYKNWNIAEKCAVGDFIGNTDINVSKHSVYSSIKKISPAYSSYKNDSDIIHTETVQIYTLDSLQNKYFNKTENIFLKIDTQGFEKEVLQGAKELLNYVNGIKIEVPLQPIYNCVSWEIAEIVHFFKEKKFKCISLNEVAVNNITGIVHEVDAIFIRQKHLLLVNN